MSEALDGISVRAGAAQPAAASTSFGALAQVVDPPAAGTDGRGGVRGEAGIGKRNAGASDGAYPVSITNAAQQPIDPVVEAAAAAYQAQASEPQVPAFSKYWHSRLRRGTCSTTGSVFLHPLYNIVGRAGSKKGWGRLS